MTYLSLGAGVQSTALLVMACESLRGCPPIDVAIFADTQDEERHTYDETLAWCREYAEGFGVPLLTPSKGRLRDALLGDESSKYPTPPLFTINPDGSHGMTRRKCTSEYKIAVIERAARDFAGLKPGQRTKRPIVSLQGISTDEAHRMKDSPNKWLVIRYPLIEAGMSRSDCEALMQEKGYPIPKRSACVFCPYRSPANWQDMKANRPESFEDACRMDEALRDLSRHGFDGTMFLHSERIPLREIDFVRMRDLPGQQHLFSMDGFGNECEGMCGV